MEFIIFQIIILLFSVVIHEVSHGFIAEKLGDPTARQLGRLTLNPLKHLDPFGSVILPLLLALLPTGIVFGWAKPVPYNPLNLKNPDRDGAIIAAAGPTSNIGIAVVFAIIFRIVHAFGGQGTELLLALLSYVILINILLAIFNLVPIPPLDGSKVLFAFLPVRAARIRAFLEQYGFLVLVAFIFFGFQFIIPIIYWIYNILI